MLNKTMSRPRRTETLTTPTSEPQSSPSTDIQPKYNEMYPFCYPEHSVWEVISLNKKNSQSHVNCNKIQKF
jgi:hypothetical protein